MKPAHGPHVELVEAGQHPVGNPSLKTAQVGDAELLRVMALAGDTVA